MAEEFEIEAGQRGAPLSAWEQHEVDELLERYREIIAQVYPSLVLVIGAGASLKEPRIEFPLGHYLQRGHHGERITRGYYSEKFSRAEPDLILKDWQPSSSWRLVTTTPHGGGAGASSPGETAAAGEDQPRAARARATEEPRPSSADADPQLEEIRGLLRESSELGEEIRAGINALKRRTQAAARAAKS